MTGSIALLSIAVMAIANSFLPPLRRAFSLHLREIVNGLLLATAVALTGFSAGHGPMATTLAQLGAVVTVAAISPARRGDIIAARLLAGGGLSVVAVAALFPRLATDLFVSERLVDGLTGVALACVAVARVWAIVEASTRPELWRRVTVACAVLGCAASGGPALWIPVAGMAAFLATVGSLPVPVEWAAPTARLPRSFEERRARVWLCQISVLLTAPIAIGALGYVDKTWGLPRGVLALGVGFVVFGLLVALAGATTHAQHDDRGRRA